jgi:hypothetical protein
MGPLLPFEELVNEIDVALDDPCKKDEDVKSNAFKDCSLPASSVLLHVTNRRKVPLRKKSLPMVCNIPFPLHFLVLDWKSNLCTSGRLTMN